MREPVTTLDDRFSEPDARPADWAATRDLLERAQHCWLCSVRADGRPHVTPLVAVWLDDVAYVSTGPGEQKAVNLAGNPHVALIAGTEQWDAGTDVVVEGEAVRVVDEDRLRQLARAWSKKWDGRWQFEVRDGAFRNAAHGEAQVFAIIPRTVLAFGKGSFSQTRHRFEPRDPSAGAVHHHDP